METTTCKQLTSREKPLEEARQIRDGFLSTRVPKSPLRFSPCLIHGPTDGYLVVELGFALANDFEPVN